jgi:hypothetical protein
MADEDFGNHGITHLIEHLAFDGMLDPAGQLVHANGRTGDVTTAFFVEGSADEVVRFINRVVANLRDLPLHRLEKEKHILQVEQTRRGGAVGEARNTRHGLQDFGLSGVSEIGLNRVAADEVTAWAAKYFTSGNVVGFFTSDDPSTGLPEGLDLSLPPGSRQPLPTPSLSSAADPLPRAYRYRSNAVVVDALVPTGAALGTLGRLAQTRLTYQLREVDAVSYSVTVEVEPVGAVLSRLTCVADTQPDNGSAVAGALVDQFTALARGHISDEELDQARQALLTDFDSDDYVSSVAPSAAVNRLLGRPDETGTHRRARYAAVTRDDVVAVATLVRDGAFWVTPDANLEWAGIPHAVFTAPAVEGHEFGAINDEETLIVSDRGVSVVRDEASRTVLYEDCVGVQAYPDGMRVVAGRTGVMIWIEPTLFQGLTPALTAALIDPHIDRRRLIPMPARRSDDIPQPPAAPATLPSPPSAPASLPPTLPSPQSVPPQSIPPGFAGASPFSPLPGMPPGSSGPAPQSIPPGFAGAPPFSPLPGMPAGSAGPALQSSAPPFPPTSVSQSSAPLSTPQSSAPPFASTPVPQWAPPGVVDSPSVAQPSISQTQMPQAPLTQAPVPQTSMPQASWSPRSGAPTPLQQSWGGQPSQQPGWNQAGAPQAGYPPAWQYQQSSFNQPPPRQTKLIWRVLSVIVAIVFALIAGFVALMLPFAMSDPDPTAPGVIPVFWVMLVVSLGFTALFIWLALRKRR